MTRTDWEQLAAPTEVSDGDLSDVIGAALRGQTPRLVDLLHEFVPPPFPGYCRATHGEPVWNFATMPHGRRLEFLSRLGGSQS
jgi:hypothetical protein